MLANNKQLSRLAALIVGVFGMSALSCLADSVQVFPEAWQTLEPGAPPEIRPRIEILAEGSGRVVEIGDFVQISERLFFYETRGIETEREWWFWLGFRKSAETPFFSKNPALRSALLGLKEGTKLKFLEHKDKHPSELGELETNPIGDPKYYKWRKNIQGFGKIFTPTATGYSVVEIKRVCKGKAQYRTLRLYDDSLIQRCTWAPISCEFTKAPREAWMDEAKIEAVCSDGKLAVFQYGPVMTRGKEAYGPVNPGNYFEPWQTEAWKKLPVGVQLK